MMAKKNNKNTQPPRVHRERRRKGRDRLPEVTVDKMSGIITTKQRFEIPETLDDFLALPEAHRWRLVWLHLVEVDNA